MKKLSQLLAFVIISIFGMLITTQVAAFEPFVVSKIKIEGLRRISEAAVIQELPIRTGQTLNENTASEVVRSLFHTGFFKDVELSQDGNVLIISVVERPSVSKLTICGIRDKEKIIKLLREHGVAEGRLYDPAVLANAQRELEKYYFGKGKYGVRIEHCVTEEAPSLMHIKFDIYEGDIAKIKQIRIVGNTVFSEKELMNGFHSSKTNFLSWFSQDDLYAKEKLNADLETLRSYYLDRGYVFIQIDSVQVSLTPDKKDIYITINITEGEKYTFGCVEVEGDFVVPEEELIPLTRCLCPGKTFSRKDLLDVKQALEDRLGCDGYSVAEVVPAHEINELEKTVDITFQINPGKRIYVRRINITGNAVTQDEVIRRELPQMEATWVSTTQIKEGRDNLLRKGFAKQVDIETVPVGCAPDQMDVCYKVEEAKLGQLSGGIGYSMVEKIMFNFSIKQDNFLGTGKMVDFNLDKSRSVTSYSFGYQDPYFTPDGVGFGASAYYSKTHLSKTTNISDYVLDTAGVESRLIFPMSKFDAVSLSLGYDETTVKIDRSIAALEIINFVNTYGNKFQEVLAGIGWRYDSLDQRIFPRRGLTQNISIHSVVPNTNQKYYKAMYDISWFCPISENERWIVNLSSTLGFGNGFGNTPELPFYRHFFAGGSRFVRGFEENSLGPKDSNGRAFGGNALVAFTGALIFPNPFKPDMTSIRTALFFDAGQVYDTRDQVVFINGRRLDHRSNGLRYSAGISLAWNSPFGLINFSLAKPLNAKPGDETRVFNFSVGTQF